MANFFFKRFTDGSTTDMAIDGSAATGTPTHYKVTADASVEIQRINFSMVDGSMTYGKFGGLSALTNGLVIKVYDVDDTLVEDFTADGAIKANEEFSLLAGVDAIAEPAAGDDFMPCRWTIAKAGAPLELDTGWYIDIYISDDISGLTYFQAMAQGVYKAVSP